MKLYKDINEMYPIESMSLQLNSTQDPLSPAPRQKGNWFKKLFKFKRQVMDGCDGSEVEKWSKAVFLCGGAW